MKKTSWLISAVILLVACNNRDQQAEKTDIPHPDTTVVTTGNELNQQTIAALDKVAVFQFTKSRVPEFNWNSFQLTRFWKEDSMFTRPFIPQPDFYRKYGSLLIYSPDSTRFIDLDSYNIDIEINANGERIGLPQGPDTEVSLVDLPEKIKTRLLFVGPGNSVEDASWLDNENLVLLTSADNHHSSPNLSLVKFNLPSKSYQVYETADTSLVRNLRGYSQTQRLKDIKLR
jgi:hypothetical protein